MFDTDDTETLDDKLAAIDAIEYDELLREGMTDVLDQRATARALFDIGVEYAGVLVTLPPDPKLADLLAAFDLEAMHGLDAAPIIYPSIDASVAGAPGGTGDPPADPNLPGLGGYGQATARALNVPKDVVHLSDAAVIFKDWHIKSFPTGPYPSPYAVLMEDDSVIANIKKARAMLPVIPHGEPGVPKHQPSGTMAWTTYDKYAGWMYVEPGGEYQDWFWGKMHALYNDAAKAADAVAAKASVSDADKMAARADQRKVSATAAVMRQEGLPPAINSYDRTVLTWCSGLAATGSLNVVFNALAKDANASKVMYLCGFLYQGEAANGEFQIADLSKIPCVYHRGSYATQDIKSRDTGKTSTQRGALDYGAYTVLEHFKNQIELLYMLIALARDPLTRDTVFQPNYKAVSGMVTVAGAENIATEALYVFIGEVQHNWNLTTRVIATPAIKYKTGRASSLVWWAMAHFTADERRLTLPSEEGDRAIAKGVFRFVLRCLQEDAFIAATTLLDVTCRAKKTKMLAAGDGILLSSVRGQYGLQRLMDNYWTPMKTGVGPGLFTPHSIDKSTLDVPGFPVKLASPGAAAPGEQVVKDKQARDAKGDPTYYSIGTQAQCAFLFPNDVELLGFDAGNVVVKDAVTPAQWAMKKDRATGAWVRVP